MLKLATEEFIIRQERQPCGPRPVDSLPQSLLEQRKVLIYMIIKDLIIDMALVNLIPRDSMRLEPENW